MSPESDNLPLAKTCPKCGVTQLSEAFGKNRSRPDGLSFYCKACARANSNAFYRKNTYCKDCRRGMAADTHIKRTYGLTRQELKALVDVQRGVCAICEANAAAHVDHDHVTGKIRGVLCFTCNVALGQLKDDVALFRRAIDYLEGNGA